MNRRKAILGVAFLTGASFLGYKFYDLTSSEDFSEIDSNKQLIAELAETLIPRTNTPGAKDVNAELMVIKLLNECTDNKTKRNFIKGLHKVNTLSKSQFDKSFIELSTEQKIGVLNLIEQNSKPLIPIIGKVQKKIIGNAFIPTLKEYVSKSYCTSMIGATQGLQYIAIPGKRISCTDLSKNQPSWATQ